jgi:hypothetical protein
MDGNFYTDEKIRMAAEECCHASLDKKTADRSRIYLSSNRKNIVTGRINSEQVNLLIPSSPCGFTPKGRGIKSN